VTQNSHPLIDKKMHPPFESLGITNIGGLQAGKSMMRYTKMDITNTVFSRNEI
jgi:hypothetical protein